MSGSLALVGEEILIYRLDVQGLLCTTSNVITDHECSQLVTAYQDDALAEQARRLPRILREVRRGDEQAFCCLETIKTPEEVSDLPAPNLPHESRSD